jgi:hypothetical protein
MRYQYDSTLEYELNSYEEKIEFAKYQMESQINFACARRKEEIFEQKLYGGILMGMLLMLPLSILLTMANGPKSAYLGFFGVAIGFGPLAIIGALLLIILAFLYILMLPVCIYKTIKGIILTNMDRQSALGEWIMNKFSLSCCRQEIQTCQIYLNKYQLMLENISQWKREIAEGEEGNLSFSEVQIMERLHQLELNPQIKIASTQSDVFKKLLCYIAIPCMFFIYICLFLIIGKAGEIFHNAMTELFRSI